MPAAEIESSRPLPDGGIVFSGRRPGDPRRRFEFIAAPEALTISTQFGCPVGCRICDAGSFGYGGNLNISELSMQVERGLPFAGTGDIELRLSRMGEPTLNPAVTELLRRLGDAPAGARLIPFLSTTAPNCGVTRDFFEELFAVKQERFGGGRFMLQFSLHSTDPKARRDLCPIRSWSFRTVAEVGARWRRKGDRRVILAFPLGEGVPFDPAVIADSFAPEHFSVKFTPVYPTRRADAGELTRFWTEPPEGVAGHRRALEEAGFTVSIEAMPEGVVGGLGACGQIGDGVRDARFRGRVGGET